MFSGVREEGHIYLLDKGRDLEGGGVRNLIYIKNRGVLSQVEQMREERVAGGQA